VYNNLARDGGILDFSWTQHATGDLGWHEFQYMDTGIAVEENCRYEIHFYGDALLGNYNGGASESYRYDVRYAVNNGAAKTANLYSSNVGMSQGYPGNPWHRAQHVNYVVNIPYGSQFRVGDRLYGSWEFHFITNFTRMRWNTWEFRVEIFRFRRTLDAWIRQGGQWHKATDLEIRAGGAWR
jgi:hypothetical protein